MAWTHPIPVALAFTAALLAVAALSVQAASTGTAASAPKPPRPASSNLSGKKPTADSPIVPGDKIRLKPGTAVPGAAP